MWRVFALAALFGFTDEALSQTRTLRVCVDAKGAVSYTDQPCPSGSKERTSTPVDSSLAGGGAVQNYGYSATPEPSVRQRTSARTSSSKRDSQKSPSRKQRCNQARSHEAAERKRLGNNITGQYARELTDNTWQACHGR